MGLNDNTIIEWKVRFIEEEEEKPVIQIHQIEQEKKEISDILL